ncbi:hypothetical protein [Phaffia rhodozyma]|uniref:Uncharacterized protein n=1 Tax=Phaffia rhodozyma TaxID=264483 RepID=A0A0F7STS8_PHARH|nr:hypothetical protein [Phaffia rhodozyma]
MSCDECLTAQQMNCSSEFVSYPSSSFSSSLRRLRRLSLFRILDCIHIVLSSLSISPDPILPFQLYSIFFLPDPGKPLISQPKLFKCSLTMQVLRAVKRYLFTSMTLTERVYR